MLGLPRDFKVSSVRFDLDSSDTVGNPVKKGLTASGNVADSHCIPVLAPTRALLNACIFNENAA